MNPTPESSLRTPPHREDGFFRISLIALTAKCNLDCLMCFEKNEAPSYRELGFDEFKKLIDMLKARGVDKIVFIGGECTLLKDVHEYVKYISDCGMQSHFTTNGTTLASMSRLKKLLDSGLRGVEFSFHSHIQKDSALISGRDNTLKQQLKALENFAALSPRYDPQPDVHVNTVITKINLPYLEELIAFYVNGFGIKSFSLKAPAIEGNMRLNKELVPDFSLVSPALEKICAFAKAKGTMMILDGFPLCAIPQKLVPMTIPFIDSGSILEGWNYHPRIHRRRFDSVPQEKILAGCGQCVFSPICQGFNSSYLSIFPGTAAIPVQSFKDLDDSVSLPLQECLVSTSKKDVHEAAVPWDTGSAEALLNWASKHIQEATSHGAKKIRFVLDRAYEYAQDALHVILASSLEAGLTPVIVTYGHLFCNERSPKLHNFRNLAEMELIFHSARDTKHLELSGGSDFKEDCLGMLVLRRMQLPVTVIAPVDKENASDLKRLVMLAGMSKANRIAFELTRESAGQDSCPDWPYEDRIREAIAYSQAEYPEVCVELRRFPFSVMPAMGYLHRPPFIGS